MHFSSRPLPFLAFFAIVTLLPALASAGPDDTPRPRRAARVRTLRSAPPAVTERQTTTTITRTQEDIIQPLRQREESTNYRFAYRALTSLGLAGSEADDRPIGYQQIYGPTPTTVYRRPGPPPPRRFSHTTEPVDEKPAASPAPEVKPELPPAPTLGPDAAPALPNSSNSPAPAVSPAPADLSEAGVLPDPAEQAAQSRNAEILSYFQRSRSARASRPPNQTPGEGYGPSQNGIDPAYLQPPEQLPLPPSRATYRVVPK